jgi:Fur family ferric uptake transcriptional regulator
MPNDTNIPDQIIQQYKQYLRENNMKRTGERDEILRHVCAFDEHFEFDTLLEQLSRTQFRVSRATLYNTMDKFINAGILIKHQVATNGKAEYELRDRASKHLHLVCSKCGNMFEVPFNSSLFINSVRDLEAKLTAEYFSIYIYGICYNCRKNK